MSKTLQCANLVDFKDQFESLQEIYNHVELVKWNNDTFTSATVLCL